MSKFALVAQTLYRRELHRYLMRRLRNPQDVEDSVQEVLLRLMVSKDERVIEKPLAYLYGTASHVLADYRIDQEQRQGVVEFDSDLAEATEGALVEEDTSADRLNLQQQIAKVMALLSPTHAAVLLAHKRDGFSYDEVAENLDLSIHTVEKYVTQAKRAVREFEWER